MLETGSSGERLYPHSVILCHVLDLAYPGGRCGVAALGTKPDPQAGPAHSPPQVGNLGLLFMLLFFIYAALGVELFGKLGE